MQFKSVLIIAILALTVSATPIAEPAINADVETAFHTLSLKKAAGCHVIKCIASLAPSVVACATAIAQEGIDIIADAACFAAAANEVVNFPSSCSKCL